MILFDQLNRKLELNETPKRIISLVPSITKSLFDIGLNKDVLGITRFCKYPVNWKKEKTIIGGTKDININRIKILKPDIIFANKEENTKEIVEKIKEIAPVYVSDIYDYNSNIKFLKDIGIILNKEKTIKKIIHSINNLEKKITKNNKKYSSVYIIWKNPWMSIGKDTFIHHNMEKAGFLNLLKDKTRYPIINIKALKMLNPEIILLSSEPFPFKNKHKIELEKNFPNSTIILTKGEPFTWFGTYQIKGIEYLINLKKELQCIQNKKN